MVQIEVNDSTICNVFLFSTRLCCCCFFSFVEYIRIFVFTFNSKSHSFIYYAFNVKFWYLAALRLKATVRSLYKPHKMSLSILFGYFHMIRSSNIEKKNTPTITRRKIRVESCWEKNQRKQNIHTHIYNFSYKSCALALWSLLFFSFFLISSPFFFSIFCVLFCWSFSYSLMLSVTPTDRPFGMSTLLSTYMHIIHIISPVVDAALDI